MESHCASQATSRRDPDASHIAPEIVWVTLAVCAPGFIRKDASSDIPRGVYARSKKQNGRTESQRQIKIFLPQLPSHKMGL